MRYPLFSDLLERESPLEGKRVLVRVDFNVPMQNGHPKELSRLRAAVSTVRALTQRGAIVLLLSHLGNPKHVDKNYSLEPLALAFSQLLGQNVLFNKTNPLFPGDVTLLENTRFHPGDQANSAQLAQELARLGDIYVFDAFPVAHRAHASTSGLMPYLPTYFGPAFEQEWQALQENAFQKPIVAALGGAKISTKMALLTHLVETVDGLIIGGGMANTFLLAQGFPVGHSLVEPTLVVQANQLLQRASSRGCQVVLPTDVMVERAEGRCRALVQAVQDADVILDIGPETLGRIEALLKEAKTLVWNGPLGAFETPGFDHGTVTFAQMVADKTEGGTLYSIAGGGETLHALAQAGVRGQLSYVSTAGGAFLAVLAGEALPVFERYLGRTQT